MDPHVTSEDRERAWPPPPATAEQLNALHAAIRRERVATLAMRTACRRLLAVPA